MKKQKVFVFTEAEAIVVHHTPIKNRRAYPHGRARSYANNKFTLNSKL